MNIRLYHLYGIYGYNDDILYGDIYDEWIYDYITCMGRPSHPPREGRVFEHRSPEDHNLWGRIKKYNFGEITQVYLYPLV